MKRQSCRGGSASRGPGGVGALPQSPSAPRRALQLSGQACGGLRRAGTLQTFRERRGPVSLRPGVWISEREAPEGWEAAAAAAARGRERSGESRRRRERGAGGPAARERCGGSFLLWKLPVAARREDRGSREAFRKGRARSPASGVTKMMPLPKRRVQAALGRGCRRGARADPPEAVVASGQSPERPVSEGRSLLFQRSRLWRPLFLSVSRNVCRCLVKCIVLFI